MDIGTKTKNDLGTHPFVVLLSWNGDAGHGGGRYDVIVTYGERTCLWPDLLDYEEGAFEGFYETEWE
jgi:hypothetical protein